MKKSTKPFKSRPSSLTAVLRDAVFSEPTNDMATISERVADAAINKALTGDMRAIEWLYERLDGPIGYSSSNMPTVNIMMPKKDRDA